MRHQHVPQLSALLHSYRPSPAPNVTKNLEPTHQRRCMGHDAPNRRTRDGSRAVPADGGPTTAGAWSLRLTSVSAWRACSRMSSVDCSRLERGENLVDHGVLDLAAAHALALAARTQERLGGGALEARGPAGADRTGRCLGAHPSSSRASSARTARSAKSPAAGRCPHGPLRRLRPEGSSGWPAAEPGWPGVTGKATPTTVIFDQANSTPDRVTVNEAAADGAAGRPRRSIEGKRVPNPLPNNGHWALQPRPEHLASRPSRAGRAAPRRAAGDRVIPNDTGRRQTAPARVGAVIQQAVADKGKSVLAAESLGRRRSDVTTLALR